MVPRLSPGGTRPMTERTYGGYTPTDEQVRAYWSARWYGGLSYEERNDEFDRWLSGVKAEARLAGQQSLLSWLASTGQARIKGDLLLDAEQWIESEANHE